MFRVVLVLAVMMAVATAFRSQVNKARSLKLRSAAEEKPHDTYIEGPAPYGKQFFQADVGVPSKDTDFGGGIVGGNEYEDALFHAGPRGTNKPKITDKAVVKLPNMQTVYRGYSEAKYKKVYEEKKKQWKVQGKDEWTPAEDKLLVDLIEQWPEGTRGRWVKISDALNRSTADVNSRWFHHHRPNIDNDYRDILKDAERDLIIKKQGGQRWSQGQSRQFGQA
jgi:hypothetical protein